MLLFKLRKADPLQTTQLQVGVSHCTGYTAAALPIVLCRNLKLISREYRRTLAGKADRIDQTAMQMHDVLRSRALVQVINILSDN